MKSKNKTAISLIVLIITVLVLSILATVVIISLSNTNVIEETNKTVFKSDMTSYKQAYELYVTNETLKDYNYDRSNDNYKYPDDADKLNEIFGSVSEKYKEGLKIQDGKLVYETENEIEKEIAKDLGMGAPELIGTETVIVTVNGEEEERSKYIGGYADTDGDGTVDRVIFADLVHTVTGKQWYNSDGVFEYEALDNLKDYVVSQENYTAKDSSGTVLDYGTKPVLKVKGDTTGKQDRFYVMALSDFTTSEYSTFSSYGSFDTDDTATTFGSGKKNTVTMISKWNTSSTISKTQELCGELYRKKYMEKIIVMQ